METNMLLALGAGLLLMMFLGHIVLKPIRWIFKIAFNSVLGIIMLWGLNLAGGSFGLSLPINIFTALIAGFLGIPGLLLLIALKFLMN